MLTSLEGIKNEVLVAKLKYLKGAENSTVAEMILYLSELDSRKLYRELGFSSLFSYCRESLGYSESGAYRRIQAARLLRTNPEVYESIKSGKLSLCAVAEIAKVKEDADKQTLLSESVGMSKRNVQVLTAKYRPAEKPKKETIRAKKVFASADNLFAFGAKAPEVKESFNISIEVDRTFMDLLNKARGFIGVQPTSEVFRKSLTEFVNKRTIVKRTVKQKPPVNSRFIPKAVKVQVLSRDNHQCTFISPDGKRCSEKHSLQMDHIQPYSVGGSNSADNLRLLCKAHNLLQAERFFGKEKILQHQLKSKTTYTQL